MICFMEGLRLLNEEIKTTFNLLNMLKSLKIPKTKDEVLYILEKFALFSKSIKGDILYNPFDKIFLFLSLL